jgi:hypothetical protein
MRVTDVMTSHHAPTPGVPASSVHALDPTQLRYCVTNYAPNALVKVTETSGAAATIHTSNVGSGCTRVPYDVVCGNSGRIVVATGVGADGNPATSSATLTASAGAPTCSPSAVAHSSNGGGLSGTGMGVLVAVILAVILAGVAITLTVRRRGRPGPSSDSA